MRDHNGQPTSEIICYYGERHLLSTLAKSLLQKGFTCELGDIERIHHNARTFNCVVLYPNIPDEMMSVYDLDSYRTGTLQVELTAENIDTFINNLQP